MFGPSYNSIGRLYNDANNYTTGCMLDGEPINCDSLARALEHGGAAIDRDTPDYTPGGQGLIPIQVLRRQGGESRWDTLWVPGGEGDMAQIDTSLDVDSLRDKIEEYNTDLCKKFVKDLLMEAGGTEDPPPYTDLLDLFDAVRKQGDFEVGVFTTDTGGKVSYSKPEGAVGAGNAKVFLSATSNDYPSPELRIHFHASNAIAEMTHVAGSKPVDYFNGAFSDYNLARVAVRVARKYGKVYKDLPVLTQKEDLASNFSSNVYHDILKHFCVPKLETVQPPTRPVKKGRRRRR